MKEAMDTRDNYARVNNLPQWRVWKNKVNHLISDLANLLPDLATLLRIYLTLPSTSCEAERSFSVLRRLKNYTRMTISQNRLNHLCILSVYKNIVDTLDQSQLVDEFVMRNEQRQARFALGVTTDTKTRKTYLS